MQKESRVEKNVTTFHNYTYHLRKLISSLGSPVVMGVANEETDQIEELIRSGAMRPSVAVLRYHLFIGFVIKEVSHQYARSIKKKFDKSDK